MSALSSILHIGDPVTVRVPMWRPTLRPECITLRTVEIEDQTGAVKVQPGWQLRIAAFLDRDQYTLCEHAVNGTPCVTLIRADELQPLS